MLTDYRVRVCVCVKASYVSFDFKSFMIDDIYIEYSYFFKLLIFTLFLWQIESDAFPLLVTSVYYYGCNSSEIQAVYIWLCT